MLTATRAFIYPVIINDHLVEIDIAEVPGNCPPLLSLSARRLGVIMDYGKQHLTIRACNSTNLLLKESSGGHPILVLPMIKTKDKEKLDTKFINYFTYSSEIIIFNVRIKDRRLNLMFIREMTNALRFSMLTSKIRYFSLILLSIAKPRHYTGSENETAYGGTEMRRK